MLLYFLAITQFLIYIHTTKEYRYTIVTTDHKIKIYTDQFLSNILDAKVKIISIDFHQQLDILIGINNISEIFVWNIKTNNSNWTNITTFKEPYGVLFLNMTHFIAVGKHKIFFYELAQLKSVSDVSNETFENIQDMKILELNEKIVMKSKFQLIVFSLKDKKILSVFKTNEMNEIFAFDVLNSNFSVVGYQNFLSVYSLSDNKFIQNFNFTKPDFVKSICIINNSFILYIDQNNVKIWNNKSLHNLFDYIQDVITSFFNIFGNNNKIVNDFLLKLDENFVMIGNYAGNISVLNLNNSKIKNMNKTDEFYLIKHLPENKNHFLATNEEIFSSSKG